jgi:hypothetical protein
MWLVCGVDGYICSCCMMRLEKGRNVQFILMGACLYKRKEEEEDI